MKKLLMKIRIVVALLLLSAASQAQEVGINIISQLNGVNNGVWPLDATTSTVLVSICNNDGGSTALAQYRIRPRMSVPSSIMQIAPNAQQTNIPPGWTIISNDGAAITLSNGTDVIAAGDCRDFSILMIPVAEGGPSIIVANMLFSTGVAPGSAVGPQTPGNLTGNDGSTTGATVVAAITLPLKLQSFTATEKNCNAQLTWKTADEQNTKRFVVEQSTDGLHFNTAAIVAAQGNGPGKEYAVQVAQASGKSFYRLRMEDIDGKATYSNITTVNSSCKSAGRAVLAYPNPVSTGKDFTVNLSGFEGAVTGRLLNSVGQVVYQSTLSNGANTIRTGQFASGIYNLIVTDGSYSKSVKVVVEK